VMTTVSITSLRKGLERDGNDDSKNELDY